MSTRTIFEIIGYVGTALVLVSFLMSSVYKLRVINTIGSLVSIVYGILVKVYPTVVLNVCLAAINIFYLVRYMNDKNEKLYSSTKADAEDSLVKFFITKYAEEIKKYFPSFDFAKCGANTARLIFCEDSFAGILLGKVSEDNTMDVLLDFTTPAYRDFSVGKFLYREIEKSNITKCRFAADIPQSYVYLRKVGYKRNGEVMELDLKKM